MFFSIFLAFEKRSFIIFQFNLSKIKMEQDQKRLADALEELKDHNFLKIHESAWEFMYYNLLRGLAIGLGSVLVPVLVTILYKYLI